MTGIHGPDGQGALGGLPGRGVNPAQLGRLTVVKVELRAEASSGAGTLTGLQRGSARQGGPRTAWVRKGPRPAGPEDSRRGSLSQRERWMLLCARPSWALEEPAHLNCLQSGQWGSPGLEGAGEEHPGEQAEEEREVFLRSWGLEEALEVSGKLQGRETGPRGKGTEVEGCLRCPLLVEVQGDRGRVPLALLRTSGFSQGGPLPPQPHLCRLVVARCLRVGAYQGGQENLHPPMLPQRERGSRAPHLLPAPPLHTCTRGSVSAKAHNSPERQRNTTVSVPMSQEKRPRLGENPCRARTLTQGHAGPGRRPARSPLARSLPPSKLYLSTQALRSVQPRFPLHE